MPTFCAADMIDISCGGCPALSGCNSTPMRDILGTTPATSSRSFGPRSAARVVNPVIFPPGRAVLFAKPLATGSPVTVMTMGIEVVASRNGRYRGPSSPQ